MLNRILTLIFAAFLIRSACAADLPDWPQWQGPDRNNKSKETGLLKQWPDGGPQNVWTIHGIGEGYGTVSIKGNAIYIQGTVDKKDSVLFCLDRATGKTRWVKPLSPRLEQDRGSGPRGTPTVEGDRVYVLTEDGTLACLKSADGAENWKLNILEKFKGNNIQWHLSESPLVDGNNLIVTPGGPDACVVALDKMTGKTVWTSVGLSDAAGYASCIAEDIDGVHTIMTLTAANGVGIRASDGKPMWTCPQAANKTANITTPVYHDHKVFYTSAYDTGCELSKLAKKGDTIECEQVYFNKVMQNHHGGVILHEGKIYGFSGGILTCLDFETGKEIWKNRSVGKGSLTYADGMLYLFSEENTVGLADASPEGYSEKGKFKVEDRGLPSWAHPVVCGGKLYIRNQDDLYCFDIKAK